MPVTLARRGRKIIVVMVTVVVVAAVGSVTLRVVTVAEVWITPVDVAAVRSSAMGGRKRKRLWRGSLITLRLLLEMCSNLGKLVMHRKKLSFEIL
jgi:hypothetical protein